MKDFKKFFDHQCEEGKKSSTWKEREIQMYTQLSLVRAQFQKIKIEYNQI